MIQIVRDGQPVGHLLSAADLHDALMGEYAIGPSLSALERELETAWNTPRRWQIIREYYRIRHDTIMEGDRFCPYELGLERYLTPIEAQLWQDIRGHGLPFLMQYPVGRRFVDFGDPRQQLAIEADGARYHNPEKDAAKNAELRAAGWHVIRIAGKDTFGARGTNLIRDIARVYYGYDYEPLDEEEAY